MNLERGLTRGERVVCALAAAALALGAGSWAAFGCGPSPKPAPAAGEVVVPPAVIVSGAAADAEPDESAEPSEPEEGGAAAKNVHVRSSFKLCGVIEDVDRKAARHGGGAAWLRTHPEKVYAEVVNDELIGAPPKYLPPPADFRVMPGRRALVVCFHEDADYGDRVKARGVDRKSQVGPYSYEFVTVAAGRHVEVTVGPQSAEDETCAGSCPWVYLEDGVGSVRVGEVLRDVVGKAAERRARLRLPGTRGRTRIVVRIAEEERGETTFLNEVRLRDGSALVAPLTTPLEQARLARDDDAYLRLALGQSVTLVFTLAQPLASDAVLEAKGYYEVKP